MARTYIFNPDNDLALANGDANYLSPRSARRMALDLALLPVWYANEGDSVLIPNSETLYYWSRTSSNYSFPSEIKLITNIESIPSQPLSPWGWNPALVKQMKVRGLSDKYLPNITEMEYLRRLSSRETAVEVLREVMLNLADKHPLVGESSLCLTEEEIAHQVESHPATILKAPWSGSGKGLRRGQGLYAPPLSGWCANTLIQQKAVIVEPLYNKVKDFAMEFYIPKDGSPIVFIGYSSFITDANGAYNGNLLTTDEAIENDLSTYIPRETLHLVRTFLQSCINERVGTHYHGYVGVDMMIVRTPSNEFTQASSSSLFRRKEKYHLHPCVEINLRMNMGVVAHILYERYVAHGHQGHFMVDFYPTPELLKIAHLQKIEEFPLQVTSDGRIYKGYLALTPIGKETQYLVWILVE